MNNRKINDGKGTLLRRFGLLSQVGAFAAPLRIDWTFSTLEAIFSGYSMFH